MIFWSTNLIKYIHTCWRQAMLKITQVLLEWVNIGKWLERTDVIYCFLYHFVQESNRIRTRVKYWHKTISKINYWVKKQVSEKSFWHKYTFVKEAVLAHVLYQNAHFVSMINVKLKILKTLTFCEDSQLY